MARHVFSWRTSVYPTHMRTWFYNYSAPLILCMGVCLLIPATQATPIYKSIDADGHVTYSSRPPNDAVEFERVILSPDFDVSPGEGTAANLDAIKQMADELESERKQRDQERKEARKQAAEAEARQQTSTPAETNMQYYPVYPLYYYPGRPHPHYPHRPRPPHTPRPAPKSPQPLAPNQR